MPVYPWVTSKRPILNRLNTEGCYFWLLLQKFMGIKWIVILVLPLYLKCFLKEQSHEFHFPSCDRHFSWEYMINIKPPCFHNWFTRITDKFAHQLFNAWKPYEVKMTTFKSLNGERKTVFLVKPRGVWLIKERNLLADYYCV